MCACVSLTLHTRCRHKHFVGCVKKLSSLQVVCKEEGGWGWRCVNVCRDADATDGDVLTDGGAQREDEYTG